jgi:hypothetical protein
MERPGGQGSDPMVSIWWVVAAFVAGGYAGALLFALLCMARAAASPTGRPEGEHRSAQRAGDPRCPTGRPEGEHRGAQDEGRPARRCGRESAARGTP